jgi:hypothetical protein
MQTELVFRKKWSVFHVLLPWRTLVKHAQFHNSCIDTPHKYIYIYRLLSRTTRIPQLGVCRHDVLGCRQPDDLTLFAIAQHMSLQCPVLYAHCPFSVVVTVNHIEVAWYYSVITFLLCVLGKGFGSCIGLSQPASTSCPAIIVASYWICSDCFAKLKEGTDLADLCAATKATQKYTCSFKGWREVSAPLVPGPPTASSLVREEGEVQDPLDSVRDFLYGLVCSNLTVIEWSSISLPICPR